MKNDKILLLLLFYCYLFFKELVLELIEHPSYMSVNEMVQVQSLQLCMCMWACGHVVGSRALLIVTIMLRLG